MKVEFSYFSYECPPERVMEGELFKFNCSVENNGRRFSLRGYLMQTQIYPVLFFYGLIFNKGVTTPRVFGAKEFPSRSHLLSYLDFLLNTKIDSYTKVKILRNDFPLFDKTIDEYLEV